MKLKIIYRFSYRRLQGDANEFLGRKDIVVKEIQVDNAVIYIFYNQK